MIDLAAELCRRFEGYRAEPYKCPAGVWTIGFGTTRYPDGREVAPDDPPLSRDQAGAIMLHELAGRYLPGVLRTCPNLLGREAALNAVVDFAYNLGVGNLQCSTLARKIRAGQWEDAALEFPRWVRGGGRVLPGLVARRAAEVELFRSPY